MRILIVVPHQDRITGNWVSAERFRTGLEGLGHQVSIRDTPVQAEVEFRQALVANRPDVALLLHAYRSGHPWLEAAAELDIPYAVMLTGTDVNLGLDDPQQRPRIQAVLNGAAIILHQNRLLADELAAHLPALEVPVQELFAGITLGTAPYNLRLRHNLPENRTLFLCPAGLRPVKGLLELLPMFAQADAAVLPLQVAFCGPILDADYAERFLTLLKEREWGHYLGVIPAETMAAAMGCADVIINNSQSEGLSNALLEAAAIGIPILARNIPGNATIVAHGVNGLLYDDTTFATCVRELATNPQRRKALSVPNTERYSPAGEAAQLDEILRQAGRGKSLVDPTLPFPKG